MSNGEVEIISGKERPRRWGLEDKLRIVAESQEPGASVRAVAARNDVYPSLLHNWRRQVREGRLAARPPMRFVPVRMADAAQPAAPLPPLPRDPSTAETIEIVLPDGWRVRVGNAVSTTMAAAQEAFKKTSPPASRKPCRPKSPASRWRSGSTTRPELDRKAA